METFTQRNFNKQRDYWLARLQASFAQDSAMEQPDASTVDADCTSQWRHLLKDYLKIFISNFLVKDVTVQVDWGTVGAP